MKKSKMMMVGMVLFALSGCAARPHTASSSPSQEQTERTEEMEQTTHVLIDVAMEAYKHLSQEKQERMKKKLQDKMRQHKRNYDKSEKEFQQEMRTQIQKELREIAEQELEDVMLTPDNELYVPLTATREQKLNCLNEVIKLGSKDLSKAKHRLTTTTDCNFVDWSDVEYCYGLTTIHDPEALNKCFDLENTK